MKRFLCSQLQPVKSMRQCITDRDIYRALILTVLGLASCF
jgi:hypothetical protein